jgi:hypothetical protein
MQGNYFVFFVYLVQRLELVHIAIHTNFPLSSSCAPEEEEWVIFKELFQEIVSGDLLSPGFHKTTTPRMYLK